VRDLAVAYATHDTARRAVDGVSFAIGRGEIVGLVGASGSGKSATALALLGLVAPGGRIERGAVLLDGEDLIARPEAARRAWRGTRIALVPQEPAQAFTPGRTIGAQVAEVVRAHRDVSAADAHTRAVEALADMGIPDADACARRYPHELSGGLRQRALLAAALVLGPDVLVADEPTSALDATVQARLLALLRARCDRDGLSVLFVSHDLGAVAEIADRVLVLDAGRLVEAGPVASVLAAPSHPVTCALLAALPRLHGDAPIGAAVRPAAGSVP
jgi:ABC-type glutathione transport system ATPase component